jgi:hypothetical protein
MGCIRQHLTFANVASAIALFVALGGGTAVALSGTNTVFTDDIANDTQPASGGNPAGGLVAADLRPNSVGTSEVTNESLTGQDIKDRSGVDTCVNTVRIGQLCFRAENRARPWYEAFEHCANLDLRLPSLAEALELAKTHDLPNVGEFEFFWTGDRWLGDGGTFRADTMSDAGGDGFSVLSSAYETVCVTTPTN